MPKPYSTVARMLSLHAGRHPSQPGGIAAVRQAALETLEGRRMFSVSYDPAGFTVVTPGTYDRVVYVSSSQGNDANPGFSVDSPVRTINKAKALVRANTGDQMLLRRGDTFREPIGTWTKGGRSAAEPMVIGAYGSGDRPVVATGSGSAMSTGSSSAKSTNHLVIQGIKFHAHTRDPNGGSFTGTAGSEGLRLLAATNDLLIEDVMVDGYRTNVNVTGYFGTASNVRFRRCVITDAYNTAGHAQGLYADKVSGLTVEESVFDHNGWAPGVTGAHATIYNHNLYVKETVDGFVARGNLISNASSHGLQARCGGVIQGNTFLDNPIHASFGLVNGAPVRAGGVSGRVTDNLFQGGGTINGSARGWGLEVSNVRAGGGTVIARNVFKDAPSGSGYAISLNVCANNPNNASAVGINDLTIEGNVVSNWTTGIYIANALITGGTGPAGLRNLTIRGNDIQRIQKPTVLYVGNEFSATHIKVSGNRYHQLAAGYPHALVNTGGPASKWYQWASGRDFNSAETAVSYPDASRTAGTYAGRLGVGSGTDAYVRAARQQSSESWRAELVGSSLAGYVLDGYGAGSAAPAPAPVPPPPPPTLPTSNPTPDPVEGAGPAVDLIDSTDDSKIATLTDGYVIDTTKVGTRLNVRATPVGTSGSVVFKLDGRVVQTETYAPYSIGGDTGGALNDWAPPAGAHTLQVLQYSGTGGSGAVVASTTVGFTVASAPAPLPTSAGPSADLIDAAMETKIATLTDGYVIDTGTVGTRLNVRAVPPGTAGSIAFKWDGRVVRTESYAPFTIGGDAGRDYLDWTPPAGQHTLELVQYSEKGGSGDVLGTTTMRLTVV